MLRSLPYVITLNTGIMDLIRHFSLIHSFHAFSSLRAPPSEADDPWDKEDQHTGQDQGSD